MATKNQIVEIISQKTIWKGEKQAPVSIVLYGDYESDACSKANNVINELMEEYEGKLRYNFRHFPLTQIHQKAQKAAEAAVAAVQEGKFWEMHEVLFQKKRGLGTITLKEYAREVGVTNKKLLESLVNSTYSWEVRADLLEGLAKGVRDVPAVFLNGEKFDGKITHDGLKKAIEEQLKPKKMKSENKKRA
jgi:protein-disulfide isomerase